VRCSVLQVVVSTFFCAWTATTLAWLCGAQPIAAKHELFRLATQAGLALLALQASPTAKPLLPLPLPLWGGPQGVLALSAVSFVCVLVSLCTVRNMLKDA